MTENIWETSLPESNESEHDYPVADPGTYAFEVKEATGKKYTPGQNSKIPECAEIDVVLRVEAKVNGENKDVNVFDRFYAAEKTAWKMTAFAKSIGVYHKGMTPADLLKNCQNYIGVCTIGVHDYNGKKSNEVKSYEKKETVGEAQSTSASDLPF